MYFSGRLEIDPSQMTMIKRVKPTKMFGKLLDAMTFGQLSDKQEHETFTALAILQQLNMGLRSMNIKNVIRLAVDDYDFYLDEKGVEDDLADAMFELKAKIDPLESEIFNTIYLVLEHDEAAIKYLIEISVTRKHKVGEYPINVIVNGVLQDFQLKDGENPEQLQKRMEDIFNSQEKYDNFVKTQKLKFDNYLDIIEQNIRKVIKVDDIVKNSENRMVRPKHKIDKPEQVKSYQHTEPIYYGYYGMGNFFMYAWLWSSMCHSHNIYCHNFTMVDEKGHEVMGVGEEGFNAGETETLNPEADFEPPAEGNVDYFHDNEYSGELNDAKVFGEGGDIDSGDSWLDSDFGGDMGDVGGDVDI